MAENTTLSATKTHREDRKKRTPSTTKKPAALGAACTKHISCDSSPPLRSYAYEEMRWDYCFENSSDRCACAAELGIQDLYCSAEHQEFLKKLPPGPCQTATPCEDAEVLGYATPIEFQGAEFCFSNLDMECECGRELKLQHFICYGY
ncbi:MAG: hypothetical protein MK135_03790 [Polyangiaceae bacterium]|nr:hypothetical protein [Polyangiaceae bacterium]